MLIGDIFVVVGVFVGVFVIMWGLDFFLGVGVIFLFFLVLFLDGFFLGFFIILEGKGLDGFVVFCLVMFFFVFFILDLCFFVFIVFCSGFCLGIVIDLSVVLIGLVRGLVFNGFMVIVRWFGFLLVCLVGFCKFMFFLIILDFFFVGVMMVFFGRMLGIVFRMEGDLRSFCCFDKFLVEIFIGG